MVLHCGVDIVYLNGLNTFKLEYNLTCSGLKEG